MKKIGPEMLVPPLLKLPRRIPGPRKSNAKAMRTVNPPNVPNAPVFLIPPTNQ